MKKKKKKRNGRKMTRHHLIPKERVKLHNLNPDEPLGSYDRLLMLWEDHHIYWHYLFKNLTLKEIIRVLQRIEQIKFYS